MTRAFPKSVKLATFCECGCGTKRSAITQGDAAAALSYDPVTGFLTHKTTGPKRKAGARAGQVSFGGYRRLTLCGERHLEHRVVWLLMTGSWPHGLIDHADGNTGNNAWSNLRLATKSQNGANRHKGGRGKSGAKGVVPQRNGRWQARIMKDRRYVFLGTYDTVQEASAAYAKAAAELFGEFARQ